LTSREQKMVLKPWGHEIIFAHTRDYVGKVLVIKAGHQLSLQFHQVKEETIYLHSGEMRFTLENANGEMEEHLMKPGQSFHIPPNRKHRMLATIDCEIFEVSTPHLEDIVRLQDQYGRAQDSGAIS
jgi:mannose-6-phosphate isomerase